MGIAVYTTLKEAEKHLGEARLELSHGGKQEVFIEHHALGWVISEFKCINDEYRFQRYYDDKKGTW